MSRKPKYLPGRSLEPMVSKEEGTGVPIYYDGESWIPIGSHRDSSGVVMNDEFEGQWKIDAVKIDYRTIQARRFKKSNNNRAGSRGNDP